MFPNIESAIRYLSFLEEPMQTGKLIERESILHEWLPIQPDSPMARMA